jgi:hypothetical protein
MSWKLPAPFFCATLTSKINIHILGPSSSLSILLTMADAKIQYVPIAQTMTHTPVSLIDAAFAFATAVRACTDFWIGIC